MLVKSEIVSCTKIHFMYFKIQKMYFDIRYLILWGKKIHFGVYVDAIFRIPPLSLLRSILRTYKHYCSSISGTVYGVVDVVHETHMSHTTYTQTLFTLATVLDVSRRVRDCLNMRKIPAFPTFFSPAGWISSNYRSTTVTPCCIC